MSIAKIADLPTVQPSYPLPAGVMVPRKAPKAEIYYPVSYTHLTLPTSDLV